MFIKLSYKKVNLLFFSFLINVLRVLYIKLSGIIRIKEKIYL